MNTKMMMSIVMLMASVSANASDRLSVEIVCSKISRAGQADQGLEIQIQSNPYAWAKRAAIVENGYVGSREIGNFQIPLSPEKVVHRSRQFLIYKSQGLILVMLARATGKGLQIAGPAKATIALQGYPTVSEDFLCRPVNAQ